jgi:1-pyrroline-5-carboxylate dehydrogenase
MQPYYNEPYSDYSDPEVLARYRAALGVVRESLGKHYPLIIGGDGVATSGRIESLNPARPAEIVGTTAAADSGLAARALGAAWEAFPGWAATMAAERAAIVDRLAEIMRERKFELAAWETLEAGKNYLEAEADVAEAIDFAAYYARQALLMDEPLPVHDYPGERNESWLIPIGAGVVIPPWNFPLAILAGMTLGPVAAGNTVVLKPASPTPVIGARFMEAVAEAGFPPGVINFLPGSGGTIGDFLVDHPRTRFVNFTGSMEVGLRIGERAAVVHAGQKWLKRSYMEMGGKDAIIVDETADLDAAADGTVRSAFGFQGQKCSACSRLIAVGAIHDELVAQVIERTRALEIGPPADNAPVGPVINASQHRAILAEIDKGRSEGTLATGGGAVEHEGGYYIEPTVFTDVNPAARLAQHEIFGPVLSVIRADDFDHALEIANGTLYGLTGGLFSSDPDRIERAKREFYVGNLYINRKITGALVGVQPFGGFNMSGSNAKAGGPDYLRLFLEMKTVAAKL